MQTAVHTSHQPFTPSYCAYVQPAELEIGRPFPLTLEKHFRFRDCTVIVGVLPGACSFAQATLNVLGVRDAAVYQCESTASAMRTFLAKKEEVRVEGDVRLMDAYGVAVSRAMQQLLARVWPPSDRAEAARLLTDPISGQEAGSAFDAVLAQTVASYMGDLTRPESESVGEVDDTIDGADEASDEVPNLALTSPAPSRTPSKTAWRYSASWDTQKVIASPIGFLQTPHKPDSSVPSSPADKGLAPVSHIRSATHRSDTDRAAKSAELHVFGLFKDMAISFAELNNLDRFIIEVNGKRYKPVGPACFQPNETWRRPNKLTPAYNMDASWYPSSEAVNKVIASAGLTVFTVEWTVVFIGNKPGIFPSVKSAEYANRFTPATWLRHEPAATPVKAIERWRFRLKHRAIEIVKFVRVEL